MATQSRIGWKPYVNLATATYLLDTYSGAAAAYSLRKVNAAYTGSAIRVRRSGDNVETDISFSSNGGLNTTELLDFVRYTNNFASSNDLSAAAWTTTAVTKTNNWLTGPDGVTPGNKITETATLNHHYLHYSIITGTIDAHNVSAYLKKGTGSAAPDRISIAVGNTTYGMYAIFNLTTGVIETQVAGTATSFQVAMTDAGNGWWRCSVGGDLNYATSQTIRTAIQFCNNSSSYNPFGTGYLGNVNADVQVANLQWLQGQTQLQRYGTTGNGTGTITTWYDQSGNGYTRTSTTAANQPSIVINGVLNTANGKVAMYFDGTNDHFLQQSPTFGDNTVGAGLNSTIFSVTKLDPSYLTNNEHPIFGGLANNSIRFSVLNNKWYLINTTGTGISSTGTVTTNQVISSVLFSPIDKVRINGSEVISGNAGTGGTDSYIGRSWLGKFYKGYFQEHIIYLTDQTSNFTAIESNINTYYTTY